MSLAQHHPPPLRLPPLHTLVSLPQGNGHQPPSQGAWDRSSLGAARPPSATSDTTSTPSMPPPPSSPYDSRHPSRSSFSASPYPQDGRHPSFSHPVNSPPAYAGQKRPHSSTYYAQSRDPYQTPQQTPVDVNRPIAPYPSHSNAPHHQQPVPPQQHPYYPPVSPHAPTYAQSPSDPYGRQPAYSQPPQHAYAEKPPQHYAAPHQYSGYQAQQTNTQPPPPPFTEHQPPSYRHDSWPQQAQHQQFQQYPPPATPTAYPPYQTHMAPAPLPMHQQQPVSTHHAVQAAPISHEAPYQTYSEDTLQQMTDKALATGKCLPQIIEHCRAIIAFANYYAQHQSHGPNGHSGRLPSPHEVKEMTNRALNIIRMLEHLGREAEAQRLKKVEEQNQKRALEFGGRDENDPIDDEKATELKAQAQMQAVFGDDKEAMQAAERDMKTIRAKRSLSQGGVLPPNKTKYKKRSRATPPGKCHSCNSTETPEWRRGPDGARTLCNACGLHYAKLIRKQDIHKGKKGNSTLPIDLKTLQNSCRTSVSLPSSSSTKVNALPRSVSRQSNVLDENGYEGESDASSAVGKPNESLKVPHPYGTTPMSIMPSQSPRQPHLPSHSTMPIYQSWENLANQTHQASYSHHAQNSHRHQSSDEYSSSALRTVHPASSSRTSSAY